MHSPGLMDELAVRGNGECIGLSGGPPKIYGPPQIPPISAIAWKLTVRDFLPSPPGVLLIESKLADSFPE